MGFSLRTTRRFDPVFADSWVWRVDLLTGEGC